MLNDKVREKIRQGMEQTGSKTKSVEILKGNQKGLWDLFENTLAISWLWPADDEDARIEHRPRHRSGAAGDHAAVAKILLQCRIMTWNGSSTKGR